MVYTPAEVRVLTPVREGVEKRASLPDLRDVFLCHAWDDRKGAAKELHDLLESRGVSVWFSEKDVLLGTTLLREIDRGLAKSRVGIVVSCRMGTSNSLREVSPLLGSRSGLSTAEEPMANVATKLAELVAL